MTKRKPAGEKLPAGRPTDYRPEYGVQILDLMGREGLSLAASGAELGFHRQRVYEWAEKHPEFADTIKLAKSKRQLFLERRLIAAETSPIVTSSIFALKNAAGDDWREKQDVQHSGPDGGPILIASDSERARALAAFIAKTKASTE